MEVTMNKDIIKNLSIELNIREQSIETVLKLLEEGNTKNRGCL